MLDSISPLRENSPLQREKINNARFEFVLSELELGLTFADIAIRGFHGPGSGGPETRKAQLAYQTAMWLTKETELTDLQVRTIQKPLRELRSKLRRLGESV